MSRAAAEIFLKDGDVPPMGFLVVQKDLAATLRLIAEKGHDGFYRGETAKLLVEGVQAAGGIWTREDLSQYAVKVSEPVAIQFHGMRITSAALPSSGGLVLAEIFNILANYAIDKMDQLDFTHIAAESMRRGYRDRAQYLGDEDFVQVPKALLADKRYADGLRQSIRMDRATPSATLAPTYHREYGGQDTSHFSVIDNEGNRVSATLSINYPFGAAMVVPGTGVLLNDEMDDFSAKPGTSNVYGLVGAQANAIEPGKRMLSSMSPSFLETGDRIAVVGTPGGSRIISMVLLAALEFYQGGDARAMVDRPRFHHQYLPDRIQYEPDALSPETFRGLKERGHELSPRDRPWGNMQVTIQNRRTGEVTAASDWRGEGRAIVLP